MKKRISNPNLKIFTEAPKHDSPYSLRPSMKSSIHATKSMYFLFIICSFSFLFFSCERQVDEPAVPEFKYMNDKKAFDLIRSDNEFGLDLFRLIAMDEECPENMMMSPVSVAMALGMTYNGAEGDTKTAFEETLRLQGFSREEINNIHQALISYLLKADPKVVFEIANSIWYRQDYNVLDSFLEVNRKHYFAEVSGLDFSNPNAVKTINDWIAGKTHNKIREMLDYIPSNAVMYLINALYFNGIWKYEFDKKNSFEGAFYGDGEKVFNAQYMKNESSVNYFENDYMSAVELPYGNGNFVMKIFLPGPGKSVQDILGNLNFVNWASWLEGFAMEENVVVQLPKFKSEYKSLLNDFLKEMGLTDAFSGAADFSGINPGKDIYISRVIHQTFIDVNEKGTEAAAATIVEIREFSAPLQKYFTVNKPFLYAITEKTTGALLFMGKTGQPSYE